MALTPKAALSLHLKPKDCLVDSATEILSKYWNEGGLFLIVGAIGAATRLVAPLVKSKDSDPAVVVIDARARNVVPILGGHKAGAVDFALALAEDLGSNPVITGNSENQEDLALDSFGDAWGWKRTGDTSIWKTLMIHKANGGALKVEQSSGSKLWINSKAASNSLAFKNHTNSCLSKTLIIGSRSENDCCWHPPTLWVGIGCERNTEKSLLERSLAEAFSQAGLAQESIAGLASIDLKSDEPALLWIAKREGWPIRFFNADLLAQVSIPSPSENVKNAVGTPSVAEAAALLAAGKGAVLRYKKHIYHSKSNEKGAVTISIAEGKVPFSPQRGELHLVGSGPGDPSYLTHDARFALARSAVWIGYGRYLDLLEPLRRSDQVRIDGHLTQEKNRCNHALDLATQGIRVALISSGDSGIYGMAGLALELCLERPQDERPKLNIHPGISAIQIAAAYIGAPLMNDFCTISLSDHLTPWVTIKERLRGALIGDFVIAIYNPKSKDRDWQLQSVIELIREFRPVTTPVVFARQLGRLEQKISLFSLQNFPVKSVDMLTVILIGNSQSVVKDGWLVNPRGYLKS